MAGQTSVLVPTFINLECLEEEEDSENELADEPTPFSQDSTSARPPSQNESTFYIKLNVDSSPDLFASQESCAEQRSDLDQLISRVIPSSSPAIDPLSAPALVPRSQTPVKGLPQTVDNLDEQLNPVTPSKPANDTDSQLDPLTPTANLKILMSAASPEIRNREKQKQNNAMNFENEDKAYAAPLPVSNEATKKLANKSKKTDGNLPAESDEYSTQHGTSRKDKSLGLLCQRFLARYPERPTVSERMEICLDEVAKELSVERRRIYDIVNVLESVEMVSRLAKNRYTWHGKTDLPHTLAKLKSLAELEGFGVLINKIREAELTRELGKEDRNKGGVNSPRKRAPLKSSDEFNQKTAKTIQENLRKDKSLGVMSQKFLMLFLVSRNNTVNLDMSAKILIGDPNVDKTESAKFKTKIRRLYDIANILTSLNLIRKVHVTEVRGRKPAFKYIGPDVDRINEMNSCSCNGDHRPSSRHSLLDCVQNPKVGMMTSGESTVPATSETTEPPKLAEDCRQNMPAARHPLSRHSSFEQICQVAEQERNRLYFESTLSSSSSQPSSPVKRDPLPRVKSDSSAMPRSRKFTIKLSEKSENGACPAPFVNDGVFKHLVVVRSSKACEGLREKSGSNVSVHRLCVSNDMATTGSEQQVISTSAESKQPKVMKLTKTQLNSVLNALGPNKNKNESSQGNMVSLIDKNGQAGMLTGTQKTQDGQGVQMVRLHSSAVTGSTQITPATLSANERTNQGVKRKIENELPDDGAYCYFESKRPCRENIEQVTDQPRKANSISERFIHKHKSSPRALIFDDEEPAIPKHETPSPVVHRLSPTELIVQAPATSTCVPASSGAGSNVVVARSSPKIALHSSESNGLHTTSSSYILTPNTSHPENVLMNVMDISSTQPVTQAQSQGFVTTGGQKVQTTSAGQQFVTPMIHSFLTPPAEQHFVSPAAGHVFTSVQQSPLNLSRPQVTYLQSPLSYTTSPLDLTKSPLLLNGMKQVALTNVKRVRSIAPSASTAVNLVPHLMNLKNENDARVYGVSASRQLSLLNANTESPSVVQYTAPSVEAVVRTVNSATQTNSGHQVVAVSNSDPLLTPRDRIITSDMILSKLGSTAPGGLVATPMSFFRSTPEGLTSVASTQQQHRISAFTSVSKQTFKPVTESIATARRLDLTQNNCTV